MKLRELAAEHHLEPELLLEVVGEDLKIRLPKGLDSELKDTEIARILASDGLETADGKPFTPIIAKEFEEKHKRSVAARKAATTRKRKIADEEEAKRRADEQRVGEERRKHGEELDRRRREDENRAAIEAEAAAARAADEARLAEDSRRVAEEELHRREEEARRMSAEFAAMREARMPQQPAAPTPAVQAPAPAAPAAKPAAPVESAPVAKAPPAASVQTPAPVAEAVAPQPVTPPPAKPEPTAPPSAPLVATIESSSAPLAKATAPAPAPAVVPETVIKATKGLGSKLANMAKQTHEKADHSIKAVAKPAEPVAGAPSGPAAELSPEDRRRLIQANIQRNLEMQKRVQAAKAAGKRPQGFRTIDRTKTPGGPGGPSRGPGGPGRGPGGPGRGPGGGPRPPGAKTGGGRGRDARDTRTEAERAEEEGKAGRRFRSTLEEDISGVTEFEISLPTTVREFSETSGVRVPIIIAKLFMAGVMANINSVLEKDAVELLALEFKKTVKFIAARDAEAAVEEAEIFDDKEEDLAPRPPIVTIMGHVDHGKTSLLDAIRKTDVAKGEAGGITQHIGAYTVAAKSGDEVTFIDTPGHQAFSEMRARGSQITDVVVIVVDAVDGVMPQTVEAINHAKAANVSIVVAMNKIDKPEADKAAQERTIRMLAEAGLQAEEWGGEIAVVRTSAHSGQGIDELLERLTLETEVLELKANHGAKASGIIIEARREEGMGVTATVLLKRGSLFVGDIMIAGVGYGRVRSMTNWKGERVDIAGPSHAVEITGLDEMPTAGDKFQVLDDLSEAAEAADLRRQKMRERELTARQKLPTATSLFTDIAHSKKKELRLVVKADASGSLEVLRKTIAELATDDLRVTIIHSAVGAITASDITLANASQAMVVGFHVIADSKARSLADQSGTDVRSYTIIYELLDEMRAALHGMLEPETRESVIGHADVLQTFTITKVGVVAGLRITDGLARRDALMRITRDNNIIHTGKVGSLRRFKEDVKEVRKDFECGLTVEGFQDIKPGDSFEFYLKEKVAARAG